MRTQRQRGDLPAETLLFMHIPKTAGTALRMSVKAAYAPAEWATIYAGAPEGPLAESAFRALPDDEKRSLRMVFGHFHYGLHESVPQRSRYITVLRDPVDRVGSLFDMYRETHPSSIGGMTLGEWATSGKTLQSDNEMVRYISGRSRVPFGQVDEEMLAEAVQHITDHFAAVLSIDNLDVRYLQQVLGRPLRWRRLQRVGSGQRVPINDTDRRSVLSVNAMDLKLWRMLAFRSNREQLGR